MIFVAAFGFIACLASGLRCAIGVGRGSQPIVCCASFLLLAAFGSSCCAVRQAGAGSGRFPTLSVEELLVVDEDGEALIALRAGQGGGGELVFMDGDSEAIRLNVEFGVGIFGANPAIWVSTSEGAVRIGADGILLHAGSGATLRLTAAHGLVGSDIGNAFDGSGRGQVGNGIEYETLDGDRR